MYIEQFSTLNEKRSLKSASHEEKKRAALKLLNASNPFIQPNNSSLGTSKRPQSKESVFAKRNNDLNDSNSNSSFEKRTTANKNIYQNQRLPSPQVQGATQQLEGQLNKLQYQKAKIDLLLRDNPYPMKFSNDQYDSLEQKSNLNQDEFEIRQFSSKNEKEKDPKFQTNKTPYIEKNNSSSREIYNFYDHHQQLINVIPRQGSLNNSSKDTQSDQTKRQNSTKYDLLPIKQRNSKTNQKISSQYENILEIYNPNKNQIAQKLQATMKTTATTTSSSIDRNNKLSTSLRGQPSFARSFSTVENVNSKETMQFLGDQNQEIDHISDPMTQFDELKLLVASEQAKLSKIMDNGIKMLQSRKEETPQREIRQTSSSFYQKQNIDIPDPNKEGLLGTYEQYSKLSKHEVIEKLLVSEHIMKQLYKRVKVLTQELNNQQGQQDKN